MFLQTPPGNDLELIVPTIQKFKQGPAGQKSVPTTAVLGVYKGFLCYLGRIWEKVVSHKNEFLIHDCLSLGMILIFCRPTSQTDGLYTVQ